MFTFKLYNIVLEYCLKVPKKSCLKAPKKIEAIFTLCWAYVAIKQWQKITEKQWKCCLLREFDISQPKNLLNHFTSEPQPSSRTNCGFIHFAAEASKNLIHNFKHRKIWTRSSTHDKTNRNILYNAQRL